MKLLIDTQILIWYAESNPKLTNNFVQLISDNSNDVFLSIVSLWEITIKKSLGKLNFNLTLNEIESILLLNNFKILQFDVNDLQVLLELPYHHSDPFDRMIISQAICGDYLLLSNDSKFKNYKLKLTLE
ncbi:MAG: type II toxin-antitoxin system VapC family toxin [Ignavibacteria bacterium]|nr:type II toxin-antitoxin system VapC family toxin [Ignavibacteria bacterium]